MSGEGRSPVPRRRGVRSWPRRGGSPAPRSPAAPPPSAARPPHSPPLVSTLQLSAAATGRDAPASPTSSAMARPSPRPPSQGGRGSEAAAAPRVPAPGSSPLGWRISSPAPCPALSPRFVPGRWIHVRVKIHFARGNCSKVQQSHLGRGAAGDTLITAIIGMTIPAGLGFSDTVIS